MIRTIRYYGDPVLRRPARPVTRFDEELARLAEDMIETMHDDEGVGLAAPQVGEPLRLFVASRCRRNEDGELEHLEDFVMVNPQITQRKGAQVVPEGCLSIPGLYVEELERDLKVRVSYQDLQGKAQELEAEGHFAQVLQHEYDHLEGILFFDRLPEEERRAFLEEHRADLARLQRQAKALLKELRSKGAERSR
ncbi:MAG TPA: peptide deformylase [Trueperaceae bacterium]